MMNSRAQFQRLQIFRGKISRLLNVIDKGVRATL